MNQLTVRDVPNDVLDRLRTRAKRKGTSLNAIVKEALSEYAERDQWRERVTRELPAIRALQDQLRREHGGDFEESWPLIREDRDR